jgi:hypothetical protein
MKSKYNPSRGGHAPEHLRDAFLDWLDVWSSCNSPVAHLEIDERSLPPEWLFGRLWNCTDRLPSISRNILTSCGVKNIWTYSQAARALIA